MKWVVLFLISLDLFQHGEERCFVLHLQQPACKACSSAHTSMSLLMLDSIPSSSSLALTSKLYPNPHRC